MDTMTVDKRQLQLWADELRSIADEGLRWSADNPYNHERYTRILHFAARLFAVQDTRAVETIDRAYHADLSHLAPYPCGDAAIIDEGGRILLIQRQDDGLWAMPGGFLSIGETPAEGTCREAWEETGVEVDPLALSGIYDSRLYHDRSPFHLYQLVFLCRPRHPDRQPRVTHETLDVRWYAQSDLATLALEPGHERRIGDAFRLWRGETRAAAFDSASVG